jgi:hypothetical protein
MVGGKTELVSTETSCKIAKSSKLLKESIMCNTENKCEKPENLKTKPEECTPEQIKECHGDVEEHPCVGEQENG